jgi:glutamyl-tRNA synthetase
MVKERAIFIPEIWEQSHYFFQAPTEYDSQTVKKRWKEGVPEIMQEIIEFLSSYNENWIGAEVKEKFSAFVTNKGWSFGVVMNAFRLAIVGAAMGADLFDICELIGKDATIQRIDNAIKNIKL